MTRTRRVLHSPSVEPEPFDPPAFPDLAERRRADGGAAAPRWRALIAPADRSSPTARWARCSSRTASSSAIRPRSGTSPSPMSSAGSSAATSSRLADPADQHVRRQPAPARPHGLRSRRRPEPDRGDPAPRRGRRRRRRRARRRRHRAERRDRRAVGTLDYDEAVDIFAEQAAALVAGGVDLIWIETMSDLQEIKAAIEGVRRWRRGSRSSRR